MRLLKKDDSRVLALYGAATLGLLALVVIVIGLGVLPVARAASDTLYTFETGVEGWQPCTASSCASDSSAVTVTQSLSHTTEGSYSLRLDFDHSTPTHTKALFFVQDSGGMDFSSGVSLTFDLWKSGQPGSVALALKTGSSWEYQESLPQALADGDNAITIDLTSGDWKSAATGWNHTSTLTNTDDVREVNILLFPTADGAGEVYLDNVQLVLGLGVCDPAMFSFETGLQGWYTSTSADSSATTMTLVALHATDGITAAHLEFVHESGHSKAIYEVDNGAGWDFSNREVLKFDLWKNGQPPQVAIALSTGSGWTWHESRAVDLEDGDNAVAIDLTTSDWKTEASGWNHSVPVADLDEVHRFSILLLPSTTGASEAYLDNVRLCSADEPPPPTPIPPPPTPAPTLPPLPVPPEAPHAAPSRFVSANGTGFKANGCSFHYVGTNNYYLHYKSDFMIDEVLDGAQTLGLGVIRTWGFLDYGSISDGGVAKQHVHDGGPPDGIYYYRLVAQ